MTESTTSKIKDEIPSVMKAAQQNGYGEVRNVLTLRQDVHVPRQLSPTQVLVRVYAASINPYNWKLVKGNMSLVRKLSFPHVPGSDVAGVVVDTGSKVKRLKIGDKVYGLMGEGAYAEYLRVEECELALKPNNFTMIEAAAAPGSGETSYQVLFNKASPPIGTGSKIVVCGGATATGLYAIQMAKVVGAHVATTSSKRNFSLLEKLGYKLVHENDETKDDPNNLFVIDYNNKSFGEVLQGIYRHRTLLYFNFSLFH
jgi:alcohol dehydrogenase